MFYFKMSDDDDWGITPDFKNTMTEQEQRFGKQAVPGKIGHMEYVLFFSPRRNLQLYSFLPGRIWPLCQFSSMDQLRQDVVKSDADAKKNAVPKASYGYGGKFGVEKDRMDKVGCKVLSFKNI